jgi:hypothetical protein
LSWVKKKPSNLSPPHLHLATPQGSHCRPQAGQEAAGLHLHQQFTSGICSTEQQWIVYLWVYPNTLLYDTYSIWMLYLCIYIYVCMYIYIHPQW